MNNWKIFIVTAFFVINNISASSKIANFLLFHAIKNRELETVMNLVKFDGADVNAKTREGDTPLIIAMENIPMINLLIDNGANVNAINKMGDNFLHIQVKRNNLYMVSFFITQKVDINCEDRHGRPPLFYAVENNNIEMIELLINNGANINYVDKLHKKNFIHKIIEDLKNSLGIPKLLNILDLFCKKGVNFNAQDVFGYTPLHLLGEACLYEHKKELFFIFVQKYQVKTDIKNCREETALDLLPEAVKNEMFDSLLEKFPEQN